MKKILFHGKGTVWSLVICVLFTLFSITGKTEIIITNPSQTSEVSPSEGVLMSMDKLPEEQKQSGNSVYSLESAYHDYKRGNYTNAYVAFDHYANMDNMHAVLAVGYLLFHGNSAPNYDKAVAYFERAAKAGFARAYYLQGLLELAKTNSRQFNLIAERLFNKAAKMGDAPAANAVANQYFYRENISEAIRWNEKAIQLGSRAAKKNQRIINSGGVKTIATPSINKDNGLAQLRKASEEGNAQATYELATRYHKGIGVNVNFGEAIRLYRVAAGQGSDAARKMLSVLLSKQGSTGGINSIWMQETSNMVAMPPIILMDKENKGSSTPVIGGSRQQMALSEDDPLDNLLNLIPVSSSN